MSALAPTMHEGRPDPIKVVIVGGVAGGMSAATRLRRLDEDAEIIVIEKGPDVSYANCGLPYYVGGTIVDRSALLVQSPATLHARFGLDVRVNTEVTRIDLAAKTVHTLDLHSGARQVQSYDKLILAPGARARGEEFSNAVPTLNLRTLADADALKSTTSTPRARVVVVGGGYTGLEAVENLVNRGSLVTLVQRGEQLLSPLDVEMTEPVATAVRAQGVDLRLGVQVARVDPGVVILTDGARIPADVIVDATGVVPETSLAAQAGLRLGSSGGIWVDESCRTSDPDVFAVGDAAEKTDPIDGEGILVTMAGLANRHGRMVADVIAGRAETARPSVGTGIVKTFGVVAAKAGWSERQLRLAGLPHYCVHVHPGSHAGYYPGAETLSMKLLADPRTDRILGAQVVGRDGVDKRIDVIATAMQTGVPAHELAHLELAYAPQFGAAKDAVNILGYVAENVRTGLTPTVQWHELDAALQASVTLVDVRTAEEFARGGIPGAINIPLDELRERLDELPDGPLIVHCQVGLRGHIATRILTQLGFSVRNLDGGYRTWVAARSVGATPERPWHAAEGNRRELETANAR